MKQTSVRLFLVFSAAVLLSVRVSAEMSPTVERTFDLTESLENALQNNQELLSAKEGIRIAGQRVNEAQSQFLPKIGLNFSGSRYLAEQAYVMPPEFGTVLLRQSRGLEADTFYSARVWLSQPIYNGGRTKNNTLLAEASLAQAKIQHEQIRAHVVFNVIKAFYDLLLVRKQIGLCQEAVQEVDALTARSSGGLGAQSELQSIRSRLRRELSSRRLEENKAYLKYLNTLGTELYTSVGLRGELESRAVNLDLAKLLALAHEARLELQGTEYQKEIDRLAVNLSQAERYPVVAFGGGYELNDPEFPLDTAHWNATLNISLPIFDGFSSRSRIRQKKLKANQSRILRTELEDQINMEVRESYADLVYWQDEIKRRSEDLNGAQEMLNRLQKGSDVEQARGREWYLEVSQAYWEAIHGHRVALAKLEKVVGRPLGE